jgi:hypothetical protein
MTRLRNAYKISVGKPEQKIPLKKRMHSLDNNKTDLKDTAWGYRLNSTGSG